MSKSMPAETDDNFPFRTSGLWKATSPSGGGSPVSGHRLNPQVERNLVRGPQVAHDSEELLTLGLLFFTDTTDDNHQLFQRPLFKLHEKAVPPLSASLRNRRQQTTSPTAAT